MLRDDLLEKLFDLGACDEAIAWVAGHPEDCSFADLWWDCDRGDWMSWLLRNGGFNHRELALLADAETRLINSVRESNNVFESAFGVACNRRDKAFLDADQALFQERAKVKKRWFKFFWDYRARSRYDAACDLVGKRFREGLQEAICRRDGTEVLARGYLADAIRGIFCWSTVEDRLTKEGTHGEQEG